MHEAAWSDGIWTLLINIEDGEILRKSVFLKGMCICLSAREGESQFVLSGREGEIRWGKARYMRVGCLLREKEIGGRDPPRLFSYSECETSWRLERWRDCLRKPT